MGEIWLAIIGHRSATIHVLYFDIHGKFLWRILISQGLYVKAQTSSHPNFITIVRCYDVINTFFLLNVGAETLAYY